MREVLLVTVECARWDYRDELDLPGDFETTKGIAAGHYTRPSLAGLLSGQCQSVVDTHVHGPTLASAMRDAGYATAAVSYSPQTTSPFGFGSGFDTHHFLRANTGRLGRGSGLRERLAESTAVRRLKRYVQDKHATFEGIPSDEMVVQQAQAILQRHRDTPLFLWVHLMGSHRPYGWGDDALPRAPSRTAAGATPPDGASGDVRATVTEHYRQGLRRVSDHLTALIDAASDDAVLTIVGDHGEELGEHGYYFHGGYRRRLVDELVEVPIFTRGLSMPNGPVSLLNLPAHLLKDRRIPRPTDWNASTHRSHTLSIAPWNNQASVRYRANGVDLTFCNADVGSVRESVDTQDVKAQLTALGYRGVG